MGSSVIDWGGFALYGEDGIDVNDVQWKTLRWKDISQTTIDFTRAEAVTMHTKALISFGSFDAYAKTVLGSVYEDDPTDARKALHRSMTLTDPEDAGSDGTFAGAVHWLALPLFCESNLDLADVQWYCSRREGGQTPVDITVTRQEAHDLATDADTSFSAFDSTAGTILGTDYSGDDTDQRKCLWRSWQRMDPEDPG